MKNKVCILDYGSGNVKSVYNMLVNIGADVKVSNDKLKIKNSTHLILPGVGAFGSSMQKIHNNIPLDILENEVINNSKPFLGICVGMQVLVDYGLEFGKNKGLGWIKGKCDKLSVKKEPLPHVGWNNISINKNSKLFAELGDILDFYFVHTYAITPQKEDLISSKTFYENNFCSSIEKDNIFGVQFHPEKSHLAGKILMKNFLKIN